MSLASVNRDRYRRIADRVRGRIPGNHGLREFRVFVVSGTWSGPYPGHGPKTVSETEIVEGGHGPKVRFLTNEELAVGQLTTRSLEIGPITPQYSEGGTALSDIQPALATGRTLHLRITGPGMSDSGDIYRVTRVDTDRSLRFMVQASPVEQGT